MKKTIFLLIIISLFPLAAHAEWIHAFTEPSGNDVLFDKKIVSVTKDIKKITVRTYFSERGKSDFIKILVSRGRDVKSYSKLSHSDTVWLINCRKKESDLSSFAEYDTDYKIISTYNARKIMYEPIVPGTTGENLYRIACE
ncbi:MAG: hypothetical protein BWX92_04077 [Deltaproteobacteria bacterium ADurb.Bin135]|nr:MAG: hypothetical protein BWX92_04077 [Deltaproteobacteria bacterium ADurb.Bin135]